MAWTEHVVTGGAQSVDSNGVQGIDPSWVPTVTPAAPAIATAVRPQPSARKVPFFGARKAALGALHEVDRLQSLVDKHGLKDVAELDALKQQFHAELSVVRGEIDAARASQRRLAEEAVAIQAQIVDMRQVVGLQEFGLYQTDHPAESSVTLSTDLEVLRAQIKDAVKQGHATTATTNFTFNNSAAQGRKFVKDMSKLMLRSYNAEAENCVKSVRAGNLSAAQKRLSTAMDQVARLGTMIQLRITPGYHALRLRELELASRHLQAVQREKELERERREELRQQRLAEQELAREKERLEKERKHYLNVIAQLEANGDIEGAERIKAQLDDVDRAIENVDYRAANIRAGYVYVISNIGAFGPDVVKIGMTRRLEPMDRVNELGDASVPFRFDVHALFFADDAVAIESMLHQHFAEVRLNKVNLRREYFRATPEQVLEVLRAHQVEVLEFTLEPAAPEYRGSLASAVPS